MWIYKLKKLRLEMGFSWQLLPGVHRALTNKVLYLEAGEPKIQAQFQPNRKVDGQPRPRLKSVVQESSANPVWGRLWVLSHIIMQNNNNNNN